MESSTLKKVHIFSGLDDTELAAVNEIIRVKKFNKGDMVFFDTEPYLGFYIVKTGLVKIYKISKDGKEHILHLVSSGNTFAEVPLFENLGEIKEDDFRYPANAMALEDGTETILVPAHKFKLLLENNRTICLKMLSGFAKRLRHLNRHIEELTLMDVTKRVANFILSEYINKRKTKKDAKEETLPYITLHISKNDMAAYLGTIIETLSRTFKKLHDDNIIEVDGKKIYIKDLEKLRQLAA